MLSVDITDWTEAEVNSMVEPRNNRPRNRKLPVPVAPTRYSWCRNCGENNGRHTDKCEEADVVANCLERNIFGEQCESLRHPQDQAHFVHYTHVDFTWFDPLDHARHRLEKAEAELAAAKREWADAIRERRRERRRGC